MIVIGFEQLVGSADYPGDPTVLDTMSGTYIERYMINVVYLIIVCTLPFL